MGGRWLVGLGKKKFAIFFGIFSIYFLKHSVNTSLPTKL
jgi:hypothetical protein